MSIKQVSLGPSKIPSSKLGLGCMSLSPDLYKPSEAGYSDEDGIKVIKRALDLGITHFDSAFVYGLGHNEKLLGKAFQGLSKEEREKICVATKTGVEVSESAKGYNGKKDFVIRTGKESAERLGTYIDIFYMHRIDPNTPIEESMEGMKELIKEGTIRGVGLSEASADTIRRAHAVQPITAVQIEWSLWSREAEEDVVPTCRELGIGVVAYSPLGRGLLTGAFKKREELKEGDWRLNNPRFEEENMAKNVKIVERIEEMAASKGEGCTAAKLALCWVLAQGDDVVPIPGTSKIANLEKNVDALRFPLTAEEVEELSNLCPRGVAAGDRYQAGIATYNNN